MLQPMQQIPQIQTNYQETRVLMRMTPQGVESSRCFASLGLAHPIAIPRVPETRARGDSARPG